jgi:hypothetical protein
VEHDLLGRRFPEERDRALEQLLRRDLVEQVNLPAVSSGASGGETSLPQQHLLAVRGQDPKENAGYRFQVELIRRWFV